MSKLLGGVISELVLILLNHDFEIDQSWMNLERFLNDIHISTRAKYYPHNNFFLLSFVKGCDHLSFEFFLKIICYPHYLLASPKNIGVHNSTLEYVSTTNISTTPASP
jgi:hypothetical protein